MRPIFPTSPQHQGPILHLADPAVRAAVQRAALLRVRDPEEHDLQLHRQLIQFRPKPVRRLTEQLVAAANKDRA